MTLLIGGLAVYKVIQIITSALPKKLNGWVIILSGAILGIITSAFISSENVVFSGLAMSLCASPTNRRTTCPPRKLLVLSEKVTPA